jgi:ribokinase
MGIFYLDTRCVSTVSGPSGVALITTGAQGENNIVVVAGANGRLTPQNLDQAAAVLEAAGFILAQLEIPLATVEYLAELCQRHNIPLMLDPAPARDLPAALMRQVTWITPNETEAEALVKLEINQDDDAGALRVTDELLNLGAQNVLLKWGPEAVWLRNGASPNNLCLPSE